MREGLVGTATGWTGVRIEPATLRLFLDATQLDVAPYSDTVDAELPPAVLAALRPDADELGVPTDAVARLNAGNRFTWHHRVRPGTPLERRSWVADTYEKNGGSGRLEFYVLRSEFRAAGTADVVAEAEATTIRRYPGGDSASGKRSSATSEDNGEHAAAGDLPERTFVPTTRQLVKYSVATGDYYEAHYDHPFAVQHGLPGVIVHGLLKLCLCTRALYDWFGPEWFVHDIGVQYRGMDLVGKPWVVRGKSIANSDNAVRVELTGVSDTGRTTVTGTAELRAR